MHFVEGKPTRDNDPLPVSPFDRQTTLRRTPKHQPPRKSATSETIRNKSGVKANQPIMEHKVQTHHMNRTRSHVRIEANMLLEKMQGLGLRPVLFLASPFYSCHDQNHWVSQIFAPPCHLSEISVECLQRMKALFDLVIKGGKPLTLFTSNGRRNRTEDKLFTVSPLIWDYVENGLLKSKEILAVILR
ncbi:unnamed protein product [Arctogadus glacialis]